MGFWENPGSLFPKLTIPISSASLTLRNALGDGVLSSIPQELGFKGFQLGVEEPPLPENLFGVGFWENPGGLLILDADTCLLTPHQSYFLSGLWDPGIGNL